MPFLLCLTYLSPPAAAAEFCSSLFLASQSAVSGCLLHHGALKSFHCALGVLGQKLHFICFCSTRGTNTAQSAGEASVVLLQPCRAASTCNVCLQEVWGPRGSRSVGTQWGHVEKQGFAAYPGHLFKPRLFWHPWNCLTTCSRALCHASRWAWTAWQPRAQDVHLAERRQGRAPRPNASPVKSLREELSRCGALVGAQVVL